MKLLISVMVILGFIGTGFAQTNVNIFLGNSKMNPGMDDCSKVYPVKRKIGRTKSVVSTTMRQLMGGVTKTEENKQYASLFSESSASVLKRIWLSKGVAYLNFDKSIKEKVSSASTSCGRDMFFAQVEKTLKQFGVKKIYYAIDGKPDDFYAWMELEEPRHLTKAKIKNF